MKTDEKYNKNTEKIMTFYFWLFIVWGIFNSIIMIAQIFYDRFGSPATSANVAIVSFVMAHVIYRLRKRDK